MSDPVPASHVLAPNGRTYCGATLGAFEYGITSPEAALDLSRAETTIQPCPKCIASLKTAGLWPEERISINYMTASELIQHLQLLPTDQPVLVESATADGDLVYDVILQHDPIRKIILLLPRTSKVGDAQVIGEAWAGLAEP